MKKVLITGSSGRIGSVLCTGFQGAQDMQITPFDLPHQDVRDPDNLNDAFEGQDAVIHLAWDMDAENSRAHTSHPDNFMASQLVHKVAVRTGVRRLIVASSVHANKFRFEGKRPLLRADAPSTPDGPYGAHKGYVELLGKFYASISPLEVISIRFGSVCEPGVPPRRGEECVWLSNNDCLSLVQACLDTPEVPDGYAVVNGVSNNKGIRVHSVDNWFGWVPKDNWPPTD